MTLDYTAFPARIHRTDLEIDQGLSPILEQIRTDIEQQLRLRNITIPVLTKVLVSVIKHPVTTLFKITFCIGASYILYLLTRGIFAGIEVDIDSNFFNIFSSNKDVRLNEGLNLTNGDQAGQFGIDGIALAYFTYLLVFQEHYNKFAGEVINECYKPHFIRLLQLLREDGIESQDDSQENQGQSERALTLLRCAEDINRLYHHLEKDLKPYGEKPIFCKEIVYNPGQLSERAESNLSEVDIELGVQ